MAKLVWKIAEEGKDHEVSLDYSMFLGKAIIKIDGDSFDISTGPFRLRGTSQVFRLGESQAIINFPSRGKPTIVFDGETVDPEK